MSGSLFNNREDNSMKRFTCAFAVASVAATIAVAPAAAALRAAPVRVADPTPTGTFTDAGGNVGYVEVDPAGAVRACNENDATPAGDNASGYAYVSASGESFETGPTYGNANVGAGDTDGEGADNNGPDGIAGTEDDEVNTHDCK